jgi:tetratricopeptide (TPR) repeat protein
MRRPPLALTGLLLLAGCSAAPTSPEQPAPVDQELMSGWRLARYAFEEGQYDQAAQMYARVLERAYARDDLGAIGDVGYELAVVRLRQLDPAAAAAQARRTRDELRRRGNEPFSELYLVEAVALYELDEDVDAAVKAEEAIELAPGPAEPIALRAWFLKGRIAADNADAAGVSRALAAFGRSPNPELQADRLELTGRLELLEGRPERALPAFRESADLRRDAKDYFGMARVLALAGEAADRTGLSADAADLYFRAGRSAEVERDLVNARRWLGDAARLAETTGQAAILAEANDRLEGLAKAEGRQRIRPRVDQDP